MIGRARARFASIADPHLSEEIAHREANHRVDLIVRFADKTSATVCLEANRRILSPLVEVASHLDERCELLRKKNAQPSADHWSDREALEDLPTRLNSADATDPMHIVAERIYAEERELTVDRGILKLASSDGAAIALSV